MKEIKDFLGPQRVDFADAIVDYLTNDYYEGVNKVHTNVNDVFLERIENYFPTKSLKKPKTKDFSQEGFAGKFFSELAPSAVFERINLKGGVDLNFTFSGELESHINNMEKYKAYAEGVKKISKIMSFDFVSSLLEESGLRNIYETQIDSDINPPSADSKIVNFIFNKFYGVALGFKLMQLPKQASSMVVAYSGYSLKSKGPLSKKYGMLGPDAAGFAFDLASMFFMFRKNFRKGRAISGTFDSRVKDAFRGDISSLESSINIKSKDKSEIIKFFNIAKSSGTTGGDLIGVMGYMAVYNRDIKNGMSPEDALEKFNDYNKTQQTKRGTELSMLQINAKKIPLLRLVTMFSSTMFLQLNEVIQSSNNIYNDINNKRPVNKKDIRSIYLNASVANVLFVFLSNIFKLMFGSEDDREEVYMELVKAMFLINQIQKIPIIGSGVTSLLNTIEGKRWNTGYQSPLDKVVMQSVESIKERDIYKGSKVAFDFMIGANTDLFEGALLDPTLKEFNDESLYKIIGVSESYQPSKKNK
jgi:hypothetical protein